MNLRTITIIAILFFTGVSHAQDEPKALTSIDSLGNWHLRVNSVMFPFDSTTGRITYTGIVEVKGLTSQQIYLRATEWFAQTFVSGKSVIDLDDAVSGKIIGKGNLSFTYKNLMVTSPGGCVHFTITVLTKDGRYKYIITNLEHEGVSNLPSAGMLEYPKWPKGTGNWWSYSTNYQRLKDETNTQILAMIESLNTHMATTASENNW
jgi:hypothetical protein